MKLSAILSCAVVSVTSVLVNQANATTFTWTGAAADNKFETTGNYAQTAVSGTSIYPGQTNVSGEALIFDATSGAGVSIASSTGIPTYQPFATTFNGANAFTVGTLGTAASVFTASGTTIRLQAGTANETFNFNLAPNSTGTIAANTVRNDTSAATGPMLTLNGNYTPAATNTRPFGLSFFGTGNKTYNGVINTGAQSVVSVFISSSAINNTQFGATTFTANNAYTGGTTVAGQTLFVNNTPVNAGDSGTGTGAVVVNNLNINQGASGGSFTGTTVVTGTTGILSGSGSIAGTIAIQSGGSLQPAATTAAGSTAVLTSSSTSASALVLSSGSTSIFDINGTTRGTNYDGFTTAGTITYGGALTININAVPAAATVYDLFSGLVTPLVDFTSITIAGSGGLSGTLTNTAGVWSGTLGAGATPVVFTESTGDLTIGSVPEPTALGLFAVGAVGLMKRRRMA